MDIKKIKYFISLAEWQNFTTAAEKNYVSQPTLSKAISSLEYELGVKLFHRSKTAASLTAEGESLLPMARELLEREQNFYRQAQTMSERGAGVLKIGYFDYWEYPFLCNVVKLFSQRNPYTTLIFEKNHHGLLNRSIQFGNCDIIFTLDKKRDDDQPYPGVKWFPIAESPLYVFLSERHPLAKRGSLSLRDLSNERQIVVSRQQESVFNAIVSNMFIEADLECKYHPISPNNSKDMLLMVLANQGVNLSTRWWALCDIPGLRIVPLEDKSPLVQFGVAYREALQPRLVESFLDCVKDAPKDQLLPEYIVL